MYSLYRRHEATCRYRAKGVRHIKCQCPVWMEGRDDQGHRQRRALKTRSWSAAQARLNEFESGRVAIPEPPSKSPSLDAAIDSYLEDCRARNLAPGTVVSYKNSLAYLKEFFLPPAGSTLTLVDLTEYRAATSRRALPLKK